MKKKSNLQTSFKILIALSLMITSIPVEDAHANEPDEETNGVSVGGSEESSNEINGPVNFVDGNETDKTETHSESDQQNASDEVETVSEIVNVPDVYLGVALRAHLGLTVHEPFTKALLEKVTEIDIVLASHVVYSLEGLQHCINLTSLEIESGSGIDLSVIKDLQHLETLMINNDKTMTNHNVLTQLPSLDSLFLYNGNVEDISFIKQMPTLENLGLNQNPISDFSPLRVTNIIGLSVSDTNLTDDDLLHIGQMPKLTTLTMNDNHVTDLTPLLNASAITRIFANRNHIYDLRPLQDSDKRIDINDQIITLDTVQATENIVAVPYPVRSPDGSYIAPQYIEAGAFNSGTGLVTFTNVTGNTTRTMKISSKDFGASGATLHYSATIYQPIEILTAAAIFDGVTDETIPVGSVTGFDKMAGVSATNEFDNIVSIGVSGTLGTPAKGTNETYILTYTAIDTFGKKTSVDRHITVTNQLPELIGVTDLVVDVRSSTDLLEGVSATDLEDGDLTDQIIVDDEALDINKIGVYPVTYHVTDSDGNKSSKTVYVTVMGVTEINATDKYLHVGANFNPLADVTATGLQGEAITNINVVANTVDTTLAGQYEVTYSVTDTSGAEVTKTINVYVYNPASLLGADDETIPMGQVSEFDLLKDVKVDADYISEFKITVDGAFGTTAPGTNEPYEFTYTVTDSYGLTTSHKRTITVTNQVPEFSGVQDVELQVGEHINFLDNVSATDLEDGSLTHKINVDDANVDVMKVGTYQVTYEVVDSDGNKTTETINVIVSGEPTITADDKVIQVGSTFNPLKDVTATSVLGDVITDIEVVENTVDTMKAGVYEVTYAVTDPSGGQATKTIKVTVLNPVKLIGADDITIPIGATKGFNLLKDVFIDADYDAHFDITIVGAFGKPTPGTNVPYEFIYTITDSYGLTSHHTRIITVTNQLPVISGAKNFEINLNGNLDLLAGISGTDLEDGDITDQIDVVGTVNIGKIGTYPVTYLLVDSDGNGVSERINVVVTNKPIIYADDKVLQVGSAFDPLEDVSAISGEGEAITANVLSNTVNTAVAGEYSVTYFATDKHGQSNLKTIKVTVYNPVTLNGADDETISLGEVVDFDLFEGVSVNADYDADFDLDVEGVFGTPTPGTNESYVFTYTVTDNYGLTSTHERTITVTNQLPVITGMQDRVILQNETIDLLDGLSATDHEDGDLTSAIIVDDSALDISAVGTFTVSYEVTDSDGNKTTETINVTVKGVPTITAENKVMYVGQSFDPLKDVSAQSTDGLALEVQIIHNTVDTTTAGVYEVTYKATDAYGVEQTKTITVTVYNQPTLQGADDETISLGEVKDFNLLDGVTVKADYASTFTINVQGSFGTPSPGTNESYTFTYTVTDDFGLTITQERTITVTNQLPVITGMKNLEVIVNDTVNLLDGVSASDVEDGDLTAAIIVDDSTLDLSKLGTYTVSYEVTDSDGNKTTETINVIVRGLPTITAEDKVMHVGQTFDPMKDVSAQSAEGDDITVEIVSNDVDTTKAGEYEITYKATDVHGIEQTKTITVTVYNPATIEGANDETIALGEVKDFDLMAGVSVKADYDSTFDLAVEGTFGKPTPGTNEDYIFTYTVTDEFGLTVTHVRTITVTNQLPVITGTKDLEVEINQPLNLLNGVMATDLEDGNLTAQIIVDDSALDLNKLGTYSVTYQVKDSDGNQTTETINVIVSGLPIITADDKVIHVGQSFDPLKDVSAVNAEGEDLTVEVVSNTVDTSLAGVYEVTYKATDVHGNEQTKTIEVTVYNPASLTGAEDETIALGEVNDFDLFEGVDVDADYESTFDINVEGVFGTPAPGTNESYEFTYTVTDEFGLVITHVRTITVTNQLPVISGTKDLEVITNTTINLLADVTATDHEDGDLTSSIVVDDSALDLSALGTYPVTYHVTDSDGNTSTETITVIVRGLPTISAENQVMHVNQPFDPMKDVSAQSAEGEGLTVEVITNTVDTSAAGVYEITYKATDKYGIEQTKTVTVTVYNPATIEGADDLTIALGEVKDFDLLEGVSVNADYDSTFKFDVDGTFATPTPGTNEDYIFTYTVTDDFGLTVTHDRTITVTNQLPVITGVKNIEVQINGTLNLLDGVMATDHEDGDLTTQIIVDDSLVNLDKLGTYVVTYQITDSDGNQTTETINVIVSGLPIITADDKVMHVGQSFDPLKDVSAVNAEGDNLTVEVVSNTVDTSLAGVYEVTYKATDVHGNEQTKTINVTVYNPATLQGAEDVTISLGEVKDFDLMEGVSVNADYDSTFDIKVEGTFNTPKPGTNESYEFTYTVTDEFGLVITHVRTITVTNQLPVISGTKNLEVITNTTINLLAGVTATDHEDGDLTNQIIVDDSALDLSAIGTYTVTYQVTDSDGNSSTETITVIVRGLPIITANDKVIHVGQSFDPMKDVSAVSAEGDDVTVEIVTNTVDTNLAGEYEITYKATDVHGVEQTKTIKVSVYNPAVIEGAEDKTIALGAVKDFDLMAGVSVNADYDSTFDLDVDGTFGTPAPGTSESYAFTYKATDEFGLVVTHVRTITVTNQLPEINGAVDIETAIYQELDLLLGVSAMDLEDGDLTAQIIVDDSSLDLNKLGTYTVTYQVTDSDGNTSTKTITVLVSGLPSITAVDKVLHVGQTFDPLKDVSAVSAEGEALTVEVVTNTVDTSLAGVYEVTYKATDAHGNEQTKTIKVSVYNPATLTGADDETIALGQVKDFDLMEGVAVNADYDSLFDIDVTGTFGTPIPGSSESYVFTYTVTDEFGLTITHERTITVTNYLPVISGTKNLEVIVNDMIDLLEGVSASDHEDGDLTNAIIVDDSILDLSEIGSYSVTYQVTDSDGNKTSETVMVIVRGLPTIAAENKVLHVGQDFDALKDVSAQSADGETLTVEVVTNTVDTSSAGVYEITYKATDKYGIEQLKTITVTVYNPATITGADDETISLGEVKDFDLLAGVSVNADYVSTFNLVVDGAFDTPAPGTSEAFEFTYTATDEYGLVVTHVRTITVTNQLPEINGAVDIEATINQALDLLLGVSATDLEDGNLTDKIIVDDSSLNLNKLGTYTVTYQVTDSDGNTTTKTITVRVSGLPSITAVDKVLHVGQIFDPLKDVSAQSADGEDITVEIVSNTVDTTTAGEYEITYKATDAHGNEQTKTIKVSVYNKASIEGAEDVTISLGEVKDFDLMEGVSVNADYDSTFNLTVDGTFGTPAPGTSESYVFTYTATDKFGLVVTHVRTITVTNNLPVITGAKDLEVIVNTNVDLLAGITATDHEDGDLTNQIIVDDSALDLSTLGTYTVTYQVTDSDGNKTSETITVIVRGLPTITADDKVIHVGQDFDPMKDVSAISAEGKDVDVEILVNTVDTTSAGEYEITYKATDEYGVEQTKTITVSVYNPASIEGAEDKTISLGEMKDFDLMVGVSVNADYDSTFDLVVDGAFATPAPGTSEAFEFTYTATDEYGLVVTHVRTITVTNQLPVINGAVDLEATIYQALDLLLGVSAFDLEDGDLTDQIIVDDSSLDLNKLGTYTVTYQVTDSDGNTTSVTVNVRVSGLPSITAVDKVIHVGQDFDPMKDVSAVSAEGEVVDVEILVNTVDTTTAGEYEITYKATDAHGNEQTKTIKVSVYNPASIEGAEDVTISLGEVEDFDLMAGVSVKADYNSMFDVDVEGTFGTPAPGTSESYVFTYKATDEFGLVVTHVRTITVTNNLPVITGAKDLEVIVNTNVDLLAGITATDHEDGDLTNQIIVDDSALDLSTLGTYTVTYQVTDSDGNTTIVTIEVIVRGLPTITADDKVIHVGQDFDPMKDVSAISAEGKDVDVEILINTVDTTSAGEYEITYKATDEYGVEQTKTITVSVYNPASLEGAEDTTISLGEVKDFDLMVGVSVKADYDSTFDVDVEGSFGTPAPGTSESYVFTYTVTDQYGLVVTHVRTITVTNNLPVFEGVADQPIEINSDFDLLANVTATDVEDGDITASIIVTIVTKSRNTLVLDTSVEGEFIVLYVVTDSDGNTVEAQRVITIVDSSLEDNDGTGEDNDGTDEDNDGTDEGNDGTGEDNDGTGEDNDGTDEDNNGTDEDNDGTDEDNDGTDENDSTSGNPELEVEDQTVQLGDSFDPYEGVTATDKDGNDITHKVEILENNVDTTKPGSYEVTYSVTDEDGNTTVKTIIVTVSVPTTGLNAHVSLLGLVVMSIGVLFSGKKKQKEAK